MAKKVQRSWRNISKSFSRMTWFERLWLLAPGLMWFSYLPRIALGGDATMNYELSIALIYVVILALTGLLTVWRGRHELIRCKLAWLTTAFVAWTGLTVLWSTNLIRGVLTFGVTGVLYLVFLATYANRDRMVKLWPKLKKALVVSAVVASILAVGQMIFGTYVQSRQITGLCAGCVAGQFGFVRPNLFAIEPQFLGSLLLAPALICFYELISSPKCRWFTVIAFVVTTTTIGLTLSRGAIYAFVIGALTMWLVVKGQWLRKLATIDLLIISTVLCLAIQGTLAAVNPTIHETFWGAVTKSINHVSLGLIDLQPTDSITLETAPTDGQSRPVYDGYVEESTNIRVSLAKTGLLAWSNQGLTGRLFGTGLGSAGQVMAEQTGSDYQKEIVQNEFVEVLLERGVIGLILLITVIAGLFYSLRRNRWVWAIIAAYLIQYCFFSGLPNALHVYLVVILLITSLDSASTSENLNGGLD